MPGNQQMPPVPPAPPLPGAGNPFALPPLPTLPARGDFRMVAEQRSAPQWTAHGGPAYGPLGMTPPTSRSATPPATPRQRSMTRRRDRQENNASRERQRREDYADDFFNADDLPYRMRDWITRLVAVEMSVRQQAQESACKRTEFQA